jgi:hypothetical protein
MQTIAKQMGKDAQKRKMQKLAQSELLRLELCLISAYDFTPHKVEYYKSCIEHHKKRFEKYL